jgi:hypothetical protein
MINVPVELKIGLLKEKKMRVHCTIGEVDFWIFWIFNFLQFAIDGKNNSKTKV